MILMIDSQPISVARLGRGMFCRAYRDTAIDRVWLLCTGDLSKECISFFCDDTNPHIPQITQHDSEYDCDVYSMPYYARLTKQHVDAWAMWRALPKTVSGYAAAHTLAASIRDTVSVALGNAIADLADNFANYCNANAMRLEFQLRNVGVNAVTGDLILRDCLFDASAYRARMKTKPQYTEAR